MVWQNIFWKTLVLMKSVLLANRIPGRTSGGDFLGAVRIYHQWVWKMYALPSNRVNPTYVWIGGTVKIQILFWFKMNNCDFFFNFPHVRENCTNTLCIISFPLLSVVRLPLGRMAQQRLSPHWLTSHLHTLQCLVHTSQSSLCNSRSAATKVMTAALCSPSSIWELRGAYWRKNFCCLRAPLFMLYRNLALFIFKSNSDIRVWQHTVYIT